MRAHSLSIYILMKKPGLSLYLFFLCTVNQILFCWRRRRWPLAVLMVRLLWFILPLFCVYFDSREKRRRVPVKDITTGGAALFGRCFDYVGASSWVFSRKNLVAFPWASCRCDVVLVDSVTFKFLWNLRSNSSFKRPEIRADPMSVSFYLPELELENPKSNRDEV